MAITDELYQIIVERYLAGNAIAGMDATTDLVETGVLDSFMLVGMLSYIEQHYGVSFGQHEIVPENFRSIARLAEVIAEKMQAGPA